MSIKDIFNRIKSGMDWFFGNHEEQEVYYDDNNKEELKNAIASSVADGNMTKEEAEEAIRSLSNAENSGKQLSKKIDESVVILEGDVDGPVERVRTPKASNGGGTNPSHDKETSRDDREL